MSFLDKTKEVLCEMGIMRRPTVTLAEATDYLTKHPDGPYPVMKSNPGLDRDGLNQFKAESRRADMLGATQNVGPAQQQ